MTQRPPGAVVADWLAGDESPASQSAGPGTPAGNIDDSGLDARTHALVRLAARIASGQCGTCCDEQVAAALDYGVTADEIAGVLVAVLPTLDPVRIRDAIPGVLGAVARATEGSRPEPA